MRGLVSQPCSQGSATQRGVRSLPGYKNRKILAFEFQQSPSKATGIRGDP
jgi:hypothetical protein